MADRMLTVRMRYQISGARYDGRPWPPGGGIIGVPEWEFRDLIRGGHADPDGKDAAAAWQKMVEPPPLGRPSKIDPPVQAGQATEEEQTEPVPEPSAAGAVAAQGMAGDAGQQDSAGAAELADLPGIPGPAAEPEPARAPGPAAIKQEWIDYAVSQGASPEQAAAMTKADLMSRYGGRL